MARSRRAIRYSTEYSTSSSPTSITDSSLIGAVRCETSQATSGRVSVELPGRVDALSQILLDIRTIQRSSSPEWMYQVRIGAALATAQQLLDNEAWEQWVEQEVGLPRRLAQMYIHFAKRLQPEERRI